MPLILNTPFETPYGITLQTSYWRWVGLSIDVTANTATGYLYGYPDEDAFNAGKQPVGRQTFHVNGQSFGAMVLGAPQGPTVSDAISKAIYDHVLATNEFFANAVNPDDPILSYQEELLSYQKSNQK